MVRPDGPLDPLQLILRDQVRLTVGWKGADSVTLAIERVYLDPPLSTGAKLGGEEPVGVFILALGRGRDDRMRNRLAGVGGEDPPLDDLGRLEGDGGFLAHGGC